LASQDGVFIANEYQDSVGILSQNVEDAALILNAIAGKFNISSLMGILGGQGHLTITACTGSHHHHHHHHPPVPQYALGISTSNASKSQTRRTARRTMIPETHMASLDPSGRLILRSIVHLLVFRTYE